MMLMPGEIHALQHERLWITFKIPHFQHQFRSNTLNSRIVTSKSLWTNPPPKHFSLIRMRRAWLYKSETPLPTHPIMTFQYFNHTEMIETYTSLSMYPIPRPAVVFGRLDNTS